jgi:uncharacterized membrane protein
MAMLWQTAYAAILVLLLGGIGLVCLVWPSALIAWSARQPTSSDLQRRLRRAVISSSLYSWLLRIFGVVLVAADLLIASVALHGIWDLVASSYRR